MRSAFVAFLTTPTGKGWVLSTFVHMLALGTLVIFSAARIQPQVIRFSAVKSNPITLVLEQFETNSDNGVSEIHVEVQPLEARIEDRRFVHVPASEDLQIAYPTIRVDAELAVAPTARAVDKSNVPQLVPPKVELPRQFERNVTSNTMSPVASLPIEATTLPDFGKNRPPSYPQTALSRGWEGTVLLRVHLSSYGAVTNVEIIESSGFRVLDGAAVNAVKTWKATPATRSGHPIETTVRLPVTFRLPAGHNHSPR